MKKTIFFGIITFYLLAVPAMGMVAHAFHGEGQGVFACPIPLAMGAPCANGGNSQQEANHFLASAAYLMNLLAIPLAGMVIGMLLGAMHLRQRWDQGESTYGIAPPFQGTRPSFLKGAVLQRVCRWLVLHRGDDDWYRDAYFYS